jgi:hypothetical protein
LKPKILEAQDIGSPRHLKPKIIDEEKVRCRLIGSRQQGLVTAGDR